MRLALLTLLLAAGASAQGTGTLAGRVLESDGVTTVIGGTVLIDTVFAIVDSNGGRLSARTNVDGEYRIIGIPVGTYSVSASFVGMETQTVDGVEINAGSTQQLGFVLAGLHVTDDLYCRLALSYDRPLITTDPFASRILTGKELEAMPVNR